MPKGATKIIKATEDTIILEATIGQDYRISIPQSVRHLVLRNKVVLVTIQKVKKSAS